MILMFLIILTVLSDLLSTDTQIVYVQYQFPKSVTQSIIKVCQYLTYIYQIELTSAVTLHGTVDSLVNLNCTYRCDCSAHDKYPTFQINLDIHCTLYLLSIVSFTLFFRGDPLIMSYFDNVVILTILTMNL
jgi:hypothetical protein